MNSSGVGSHSRYQINSVVWYFVSLSTFRYNKEFHCILLYSWINLNSNRCLHIWLKQIREFFFSWLCWFYLNSNQPSNLCLLVALSKALDLQRKLEHFQYFVICHLIYQKSLVCENESVRFLNCDVMFKLQKRIRLKNDKAANSYWHSPDAKGFKCWSLKLTY